MGNDGLAFLITEMSLGDPSSSSEGSNLDQSENSSCYASILEMQQQAYLDHQKLQRQHSQKMMSDVTGKAFKFVERMIQKCQKLPNQDGRIGPVSFDSLVEFTEQF